MEGRNLVSKKRLSKGKSKRKTERERGSRVTERFLTAATWAKTKERNQEAADG